MAWVRVGREVGINGLSRKHQRFVNNYWVMGGERAAIEAGYAESNASATAGKLMGRPDIQQAVTEVKMRAMAIADVTVADIVRETWEIASNHEYAPAARVSALALLAKRHVEFSDKHEIKHDVVLYERAIEAISLMEPQKMLELANQALMLDDGGDSSVVVGEVLEGQPGW